MNLTTQEKREYWNTLSKDETLARSIAYASLVDTLLTKLIAVKRRKKVNDKVLAEKTGFEREFIKQVFRGLTGRDSDKETLSLKSLTTIAWALGYDISVDLTKK
jgi:hypothetical protein